jgi:hypothetical protein
VTRITPGLVPSVGAALRRDQEVIIAGTESQSRIFAAKRNKRRKKCVGVLTADCTDGRGSDSPEFLQEVTERTEGDSIPGFF